MLSEDTDWMGEALCGRHRSADWTTEKPSAEVRRRLAEICAACPVIGECAAYALASEAEIGTYAGVLVPLRGVKPTKPTKRWNRARAELARVLEQELIQHLKGKPNVPLRQ